MDQLTGKVLNHYQIVSLLGEGGMGSVYKARDVTLQRDVALKVMHPQYTSQQDFQDRFLQEARVAARLDHPGIVKVFDFGMAQGVLYIVMEFIPGENLRKMMQNLRAAKQWIVLGEAVEIVRQISQALDYTHQRGILHRDIKPDNIMLKPEPSNGLPYRPVITDLGLAKLREGGVMTQDGLSMGTPAYMSPEQAMGEKTDAKSDVYSLGILLYEMVTGKLPFPARTLSEAIRYHVKEQPPDPRTIKADLPENLAQIILKAIQKKPEDRFASAAALADALGGGLPAAGSQPAAEPTALAGTVSLVTQLQQGTVEPRGPSLMEEFPKQPASGITKDRIQIVETGHTGKSVAAKSEGMTIGRDDDNDIVIQEAKVSRHHARIEFDGSTYRVSDLNSTNGTYLGNARLLPGIAEIWTTDKILRIGDAYLKLELASASTTTSSSVLGSRMLTRSDGTVVDPGEIRSSQGDGRIGVYLEPAPLSVPPGGALSISLLVMNQGPVVDWFKTTVSGFPATWLNPAPAVVQLMPGDQKEISLTIQPPVTSQTRAGRYPITFRVSSQAAPDQFAEVKSTLTVTAFSKFRSEMHPQKIRAGQTGQVTVQNQGNTPETYTVAFEDRGNELAFTPPQTKLNIPEGQSATVQFQALPRSRKWFGGEASTSFIARVASPGGELQSQSGEIVSKGRFPSWILAVIPLLCLCLAASGVFGYTQFTTALSRQTGTAQAIEVAFFATQDAGTAQAAQMMLDRTATQEALSKANQATQDAYKVTQEAQAATQTEQAKPTTPGPTDTPMPPTSTSTSTPTSTPTLEPTFTSTPPGPWQGTWASSCELLTCGDLSLSQNGNSITGTYANGDGALSGAIQGSHLSGSWSMGGATGPFDFWMSSDGQILQGNWNRTFNWCASRNLADSQPSPCGLASWYGEWLTACGTSGCGTMTLIQNGSNVIGTYAGGAGTINATVSGTVLKGTWNRSGNGNLAFFMSPEGKQFSGNFGGNNEWCGNRSDSTLPNPCFAATYVNLYEFKYKILATLMPPFKILPMFTLPPPNP